MAFFQLSLKFYILNAWFKNNYFALYTIFDYIYFNLDTKKQYKNIKHKNLFWYRKTFNYHRLERVFDSLIKSTGIKLTHNNTFTQNKSCFTDTKFWFKQIKSSPKYFLVFVCISTSKLAFQSKILFKVKNTIKQNLVPIKLDLFSKVKEFSQ
jgi:hypothetical protein